MTIAENARSNAVVSPEGKIICARCGNVTPRRTNGKQKYCPKCSKLNAREKRDAGLKRYREKHRGRLRIEGCLRAKKKRDEILPLMRERALILNEQQELPDNRAPIHLKKGVIVRIPYHRGISKNYSYGFSSNRHVFLKSDARAIREAIHYAVKTAADGIQFSTGKVWVDILMEKPDHRGDAVNSVDAICDGIKKAIGVDDRWFSIRRLDWVIVKKNPVITLVIGQENDDEHEVCYFCGRVRPISEFNKRKKICVDCRKDPRKT